MGARPDEWFRTGILPAVNLGAGLEPWFPYLLASHVTLSSFLDLSELVK